jgi:DNA transformation protein
MASPNAEFAHYCCELMADLGPCVVKRMFGGWGISTDGLTVAILANLGDGEILWLKANEETRTRFEAEGCARFTYPVKGQPKSMNYYSAPADAMESPALMAPWARLALEAALIAKNSKPAKKRVSKSAKPPRSR